MLRLADLTQPELISLFSSVQHVGNVIERAYGADGLTVACQDGKAAGQSVPHVHVHILPRKFSGDRFESKNDEVYPALEKSEAELSQHLPAASSSAHEPLKMDADDDRKPRTIDEMVKEAEWLKSLFENK